MEISSSTSTKSDSEVALHPPASEVSPAKPVDMSNGYFLELPTLSAGTVINAAWEAYGDDGQVDPLRVQLLLAGKFTTREMISALPKQRPDGLPQATTAASRPPSPPPQATAAAAPATRNGSQSPSNRTVEGWTDDETRLLVRLHAQKTPWKDIPVCILCRKLADSTIVLIRKLIRHISPAAHRRPVRINCSGRSSRRSGGFTTRRCVSSTWVAVWKKVLVTSEAVISTVGIIHIFC